MANKKKGNFVQNINTRKLVKYLAVSQGVATIVWILLIIPSVLWWKNSIVWIVYMSAWANVAGHFSAFVVAIIDYVRAGA